MKGCDMLEIIERLRIKNFRIFNKNSKSKINDKECGIVNQNDHWACYWKYENTKYYFDSLGRKPPENLIKYMGDNIIYNKIKLQENNDNICGYLCIAVLKLLSDGFEFSNIIDLIHRNKYIYLSILNGRKDCFC